MNILHITREHDSTTRKPLLSLIQIVAEENIIKQELNVHY